MANSKYGYVRSFEQPDTLLVNTWIVVRIDGRGFSKFTAKYNFMKPNDRRALDLMNAAAEGVMKELPDLVLGYGVSDEYSFVFHKDCSLFERRASKLTTTIVSTFSSYYTFLWPKYFPETPLTPPLPSFDGRAVCYPSDQNLRDYMSWRQVDAHINNLYNTTFWALVQEGGMDPRAAEQELSHTVSSDKNEILWSRFGKNYNREEAIFRKGSVIYRDYSPSSESATPTPPRTSSTTPTSPPPLSHPQPRPVSQRISLPVVPKSKEESETLAPRGPTFLSTSTTPSPPPSATSYSFPALPAFPQTFFPVAPTATATAPVSKACLPQLVPLPLPPPTLTPSTGPPTNLNPPAVTGMSVPAAQARPVGPIIPSRTVSTSATKLPSSSRSKQRPGSSSDVPRQSPSRPTTLKHRSPSLSILEGGAPPKIPLRISSIPLDSAPRKLSLQSQRSFANGNGQRSNNTTNHNLSASVPTMSPSQNPRSPLYTLQPLQTWKQLPPAPPESSPDSPTLPDRHRHSMPPSPLFPSLTESTNPTSPTERQYVHSPTTLRRERSCSHTRIGSAPVLSSFEFEISPSSTAVAPNRYDDGIDGGVRVNDRDVADVDNVSSSFPIPPKSKQRESSAHITSTMKPLHHQQHQHRPSPSPQPPQLLLQKHNPTSTITATAPSKSKSKPKPKSKPTNGNTNETEQLGTDGRPLIPMSKTARDKERKKKSKARIVIEHVDLIKDEFWERRPWILRGTAG